MRIAEQVRSHDMWKSTASLLFGSNEPKEMFKTSSEFGFPRMYTERHISSVDYRYWVQFTTLFRSAEDVFSTLSVQEIHKVIENAPENIVTLVDVLTLHLESLINDPHFAPVPPKNPGGWDALFASNTTTSHLPSDGRNRHEEALNCCRVLSRIIPVIYETDTLHQGDIDITDLEQSALWSSKTRSMRLRANKSAKKPVMFSEEKDSDGGNAQENHFILTDGDESLADPFTDPNFDAGEAIPSTGHALIMTVMELLFHSGFTMPWTEEQFIASDNSDVSRIHFTIWEAGIGSPVDLENTTQEHIHRRSELMRLLLVLLAKPMYVRQNLLSATPMNALEFVTCELERPVVLSFLCSLLNTVSNYRQADRWRVLGADVVRDMYTSLCLEVLCALLAYEPKNDSNLFVFYANKLYREGDFLFLMNGAGKIFRRSMADSHGAFEIGTRRATFAKPAEEHVSEMLVILWVLLRTNNKLCETVTQSPKIAFDMLSWLLYVALSNKSSPATRGQAELAIFLLQYLSAQKDFAKLLSKPNSAENITTPPRLLRQQGSLAVDMLIEGVYLLITSSSGLLAPVYVSTLLILFNTSPYWQGVSSASASRLEQLLHQLASPKFLLHDPSHPYLLGLLLDTLSRAVQYNYGSNVNLVYVLVRSAHIIERTRTFNLKSALTMVHFVREHAKSHVSQKELIPSTMPNPDVKEDEAVMEATNSNQGKDVKNEGATETIAIEGNEEAGACGEQKVNSEVSKSEVEVGTEATTTESKVETSDVLIKEEKGASKSDSSSKEVDVDGKDVAKDTIISTQSSNFNKDVVQADDRDNGERFEADKVEENSRMPACGAADYKEAACFEGLSKVKLEEAPPVPPKSVDVPTNKQLEHIAATIGKNGFIPTQEWIDEWLPTLNFDVLDALLKYIVPRVNEFCADPSVSSGSSAHEQVLEFFHRDPLPSSIIPKAPEPLPRTFNWTDQSYVWLQSYIWGLVYAVGVSPLAVWFDTHTHLFEVRVEQPPESNIERAVNAFSSLTSSVLSQLPY